MKDATFLVRATLACTLAATGGLAAAQQGVNPSTNPTAQVDPGPATGAIVDKTASAPGAGRRAAPGAGGMQGGRDGARDADRAGGGAASAPGAAGGTTRPGGAASRPAPAGGAQR